MDAVPMANTYSSASDYCSREFVPVIDFVIMFTVEHLVFHAALRFWFLLLAVLVEYIPRCPPCSSRSDVA